MNLLYGTSSFIPLLLFLCFLYLTVPGCIWPVTSTIQHSLLWFLLSTINQAVKLILPLDLHKIINFVSNSGHLYRISKDKCLNSFLRVLVEKNLIIQLFVYLLCRCWSL